MFRYIACCDCGTDLIKDALKAATALSLCKSCWAKLPQDVIVRRSKEHEEHAHDGCLGVDRNGDPMHDEPNACPDGDDNCTGSN